MLMLCHPDSSASNKLKAELLNLLIKHKTRLIQMRKHAPKRGRV
jgi:hypothetical protein